MRIGILTFHRAYNYGAVLQCYALKEVLKKMGHDVQVIDYRQPYIEKAYKYHFSFSEERMKEMSIIKVPFYIGLCIYRDIKQYFIIKKKKKVFESFQDRYLDLTVDCKTTIPSDFDRYVIGSDMLWSDECMGHSFDDIYLGKFQHKEDSRIIGYAISGTPNSFEKLGKETEFDFLSNFYSLSVREKTLSNIINNITGKTVPQCIDPTLLTTKDLWSSLVEENIGKRNHKYLVTYFLRRVDRSVYDRINNYAKNNGYEVVDIDVSPYAIPISVKKFVSTIANANYIVTDSFHGMVFSMIFERPFHAMTFNDAHDMRYVDILKRIGLDEAIATPDYLPYIPQIDYSQVNKNIESFRQSSLQYLNNSL